ncbi:MAG: ATP-grasp domain-containing protein [Acidimicrobiales bacterium]
MWRELGASRLVVEEVVAFRQELSVVVARGSTGEMVDHGVMGNVHVNGMLDTTVTPADVPEAVSDEARRLARRVAEVVGLCGVLCVELFWVDGRLLVNEIAPRPHNSGHCTIEAAPCGQFEQQVRAICGLPLGDGACRPAAMVQLLGDLWHDGEPRWSRILADPMISLHLYGKSEALPGRKMGHLTCVDSSADAALERLLAARARLGRA